MSESNIEVQKAVDFIRQIVAGECDQFDLEEIREAIDRCLGEEESK